MRKSCIIAIIVGMIGCLMMGSAKARFQGSNIISIQADPTMEFIQPITRQLEAKGIEVRWVTNEGEITLEVSETATLITLHRMTSLPIPQSALLHPLTPIILAVPLQDTVQASLWAVDYVQGDCSTIPNQDITRLLWLHCQLAQGTSPDLLDSIMMSDPIAVQAIGWWIQGQAGKSEIALQHLNEHMEIPHQDEEDEMALLSYRASLHALRFEYDLAVLDLQTALQQATTIAQSTFLQAKLHKQLGDTLLLLYEWDQVLEQYNTALDLSPSFAEAYWARGMLYYTKGILQNAKEDFNQYLLLSPTGYYSVTAQRALEEIEHLLEGL